ncbi:MAG: primosomal protein N', partial [Muribaculaceae bacterium]|nr:primosomal protein N' [Muribaculaceae bacterium]
LLPLPLYSTFTYIVPEEMESSLQVGSRVLVQFGRKKFYTAIVDHIHSNAPKGYEVKPILGVLDANPIIRYPQMKLWKWIADYYLCAPGEVYKAAVPTGLKPESETFITLNPDYEPDEKTDFRMSERQAIIVQVLQEKKRLRLSELEKETGLKNVTAHVSALLDQGIVEIDEKVMERYRPKKTTLVGLTFERGDSDRLHECFNLLTRSRQQEKALLAYLDLSGWISPNAVLRDVEKEKLLKVAGISPGILRALVEKGIFRIYKKSVNRFAAESDDNELHLSPLSEAQSRAFSEIVAGFKETPIQLLHGVTGSGKTEIYTHLIAEVLKRGDQVLFLVPEISLTTQLSDRLRKVFGNRLLVYHSKFSDSERVDIWRRLLAGNEPLVILGARSSVFLPFAHLGLVIVDEEHEASFKQYDPAPRYNARDVSLVLAQMHGAKSLLGSATPSIETYYKAKTGKYGLTTLSERFEGATLPDVDIVDMKEMRAKKEVRGIISSPLRQRILSTLKEKKQVILFQNRRGFAPVVVCDQCGWSPKCVNCDVSMVYHKNTGLLRCHYCGFTQLLPKLCPVCGQNTIRIFGYGTERIAEEVHEQFEGYRVARMDLDTTRNKDAFQEIIEEFARHETDILVGTQMVSKGLDFGDVSTVGVLNADTLLNFPDFRSNERAFNMLEQVAGRAGRRKEKGRVVIQTVKPSHEILHYVKAHDYPGYYEAEIADRERFGYPPFTKVINIYLKNKDALACDRAAVAFALALREVFGQRVLGPEKPFVSRIATYYLQSIMLKIESGASMKKVKDLLRAVLARIAENPDIKSSVVYYDVDPV